MATFKNLMSSNKTLKPVRLKPTRLKPTRLPLTRIAPKSVSVAVLYPQTVHAIKKSPQGQLPPGLAASLTAQKKTGSTGPSMVPEQQEGTSSGTNNTQPLLTLHPQTINAIKRSPAGSLPPSLASSLNVRKGMR